MSATPPPAVDAPADLVMKPTEDGQVAQNSPPHVVVVSAAPFDLKTYLREVGRPDLALLQVRAQMQDGKLILRGMVTLDVQRRELLTTVEQAPGIEDVNAVDLLLRPQPTYTVQEGDTLWTIVYDIYGNVDRLEEFFEYNRDVLPSPDAVSVGLVSEGPTAGGKLAEFVTGDEVRSRVSARNPTSCVAPIRSVTAADAWASRRAGTPPRPGRRGGSCRGAWPAWSPAPPGAGRSG